MDETTLQSPSHADLAKGRQHGKMREPVPSRPTLAKDDSEEVQRHLQLVSKRTSSTTSQSRLLSELMNAPLFSLAVQRAVEEVKSTGRNSYTQYGLLGGRKTTYHGVGDAKEEIEDSKQLVYANMEVPWSTFICGSQGGGKSHTLSCLLENALVQPSVAGKLPNPLAGIVFHYDTFASVEVSQPCEAAYLCSTGMPVRVLVSSSNYAAMYKHYRNLPNLPRGCPQPEVIRLMFSERQLNVSIVKTLMAFDSDSRQPLYMAVLDRVLRQMATERTGSSHFDYTEFKKRLKKERFSEQQEMMLQMRLDLLESFLDLENNHVHYGNFEAGTLTVVDLSCPFVDPGAACALFSICLSLFLSRRGDSGRIVALDEAHKFLTQGAQASQLTDQLNSVIRQQRHLATRVIIATQEPTLSPTLIDLSDVSIVHRFRSPAWFEVLKNHLAGLSKRAGTNTHDLDSVLQTIYGLETGEALVFCPTSVMDVPDGNAPLASVKLMRDTFVKLKIRQRVTADGGKSIMASDKTLDRNATEDGNSILTLAERAEQLRVKAEKSTIAPGQTFTQAVAGGVTSRMVSNKNMEQDSGVDGLEGDSVDEDDDSDGSGDDDDDDDDDGDDDDDDDLLSGSHIARTSSTATAAVAVARATANARRAAPQPTRKLITEAQIISHLKVVVNQALSRDYSHVDFGEIRRATETHFSLPIGHLSEADYKFLTRKAIRDTSDQFFRKNGVHPKPKWANWS